MCETEARAGLLVEAEEILLDALNNIFFETSTRYRPGAKYDDDGIKEYRDIINSSSWSLLKKIQYIGGNRVHYCRSFYQRGELRKQIDNHSFDFLVRLGRSIKEGTFDKENVKKLTLDFFDQKIKSDKEKQVLSRFPFPQKASYMAGYKVRYCRKTYERDFNLICNAIHDMVIDIAEFLKIE